VTIKIKEGHAVEDKIVCGDCYDARNFDGRHEMYDVVRKYIDAGLNVALVGPAGTGKSYMARQIAKDLGRDFYVNGAMMSKYDLIGYCDAHGEYHATPAYDAFTKGGVHCFDELDASAPEAVVAFNGMTDDQPFYTFPCGQRDQHDDYVALACMNTYGNGASADYVGRFKQDAASMSRFVRVYIDYDKRIERSLAGKNADILQRVWDLREACTRLAIRHIVSTRMVLFGAKAREAKATRKEIDRDVLFAGLDDNALQQIKAQMRDIARERGAS
jgi:MoxR-like ATPase